MKILLSFFRIRLSCPGLSGIGILRVRNPGIRFYGGCCSRIPGRFFPVRLKDLGIVPSRRACIDCRGNFCLRLADVSDSFHGVSVKRDGFRAVWKQTWGYRSRVAESLAIPGTAGCRVQR